jgi:hypothetical protein
LPGFSLSTPNGRWSSSNWGTGWHLFEFFVKFNSGTSAINETNDGECFVRIDSTVYVDARGLFNRHWSNEPIYRVGILNQSQGSASGPFEIWYDNIFISTTKPA